MARDCTERFQSVEEMSKEVLSWLEGALERRDKALVAYQSSLDFYQQYHDGLIRADECWVLTNKALKIKGLIILNGGATGWGI